MISSCNAAGDQTCDGLTGADGSTTYDYQNGGCGSNPPGPVGFNAFNDFIPTKVGETYALLIINWTGSSNGYTLNFDVGEVDIFDQLKPAVKTIDLPEKEDCNIAKIDLQFSEYVTCVSFMSSSVSLMGPNGLIPITIESLNCQNGGTYDKNYELHFTPPLNEPGNYTLSFDNSPLDLCDNYLVPATYTFELNEKIPGDNIVMDSVFCDFVDIEIDVTESEASSYLWENGSTDPIRLLDAVGTYSVEIINPCLTRRDIFIINVSTSPSILDIETFPDYCNERTGLANPIFNPSEGTLLFSLDGSNFVEADQLDSLSAGTYTLFIMNSNGCQSEESFQIEQVESDFEIIFPQDEFVIDFGNSVILEAITNGAISDYYWTADSSSLSCINCLTPTATPLFTTEYTFHVIDENGCELQDKILVRVDIPRDFYAPTIFSPNNDGVNEKFIIYGGKQLVNINKMAIYSRWGELIYQIENVKPGDENAGWNGLFKNRPMNVGVYSWVVELEYIDKEIFTYFGHVTLLK